MNNIHLCLYKPCTCLHTTTTVHSLCLLLWLHLKFGKERYRNNEGHWRCQIWQRQNGKQCLIKISVCLFWPLSMVCIVASNTLFVGNKPFQEWVSTYIIVDCVWVATYHMFIFQKCVTKWSLYTQWKNPHLMSLLRFQIRCNLTTSGQISRASRVLQREWLERLSPLAVY